MIPALIDTHTHLDFNQFESDLDDVVYRAKEAGVAGMITIGIDFPTSLRSIEIAENYKNVFAAAGIHPHDAGSAKEEDFEQFYELYSHPKVVAIGEVGLDFYRNLTEPEIQRKVLRRFLQWSTELNKPLIIHTRDADEEILSIMRDYRKQGLRGVFHCFSGDKEMAAKVLDMGFYISFTGTVTFKNSSSVEIAKYVPLDRIMVETDCPFMAPVPHRGKRNEPAFVTHIAARIAEIKDVSYNTLAAATTQNAKDLFGFKIENEEW